jgi:hypothetical protein
LLQAKIEIRVGVLRIGLGGHGGVNSSPYDDVIVGVKAL